METSGKPDNENVAPGRVREEPGGIGRNVVVMGVVSLLTDISSEMIYPVLPLFLSSVLNAPVAAIGLIEGIAESTASVLKIFSGWLSDKLGRRKPLVFAGYALSGLTKPLLALTTAWPQVLAIRFLDRAGKGIRTAPRDAIIADSCDEAVRGKAFGIHRAMDTLGAALGPLIAAMVLGLVAGKAGFRLVFWISAVPGVLAIIVLLIWLKERRPHDHENAPEIRFSHLGKRFGLFCVAAGIFSIGNSSDAFLILRTKGLGVPVALVPLAYFGFNMVYSALSAPFGALSDRVGRRPVIVAGWAVFGLIYLGFAFADAAWQAWVLLAGYGIYYALTEGVQRAFIVDLVPQHMRASALGTFNFVTAVALLPASVIGGALWQMLGAPATFIYGAACAGTALVMLLLVRPLGQAQF